MSREWEEREKGLRPVVQHTLESPLTICSKARIYNKSHPFVLPGLGESGPKCMCKKAWGIGIDGKKLGYVNLKCKRIECKNCYLNWVLEKVYESAFILEAYAKVTGERPAHVTAEIIGISDKARSWDMEDYDTFHRRTYRHIEAMGGLGGLRAFHPYKIHSHIKKSLISNGYGIPGNGFWKGVRNNALNLKTFDEYYYLAPHDHNIVFPSFLDEHVDNKFFVKKIKELSTMEDTIKALFYLVSHVGVYKDNECKDNHPLAFFGKLHRFKPEKYLSDEEIKTLKSEISSIMNYDPDNETPSPDSNKDQFIPIHEFNMYSAEKEQWTNAVISSFPENTISFWWSLVLEYNDKINNSDIPKEDRHIFIDDLVIPPDIELVEVT